MSPRFQRVGLQDGAEWDSPDEQDGESPQVGQPRILAYPGIYLFIASSSLDRMPAGSLLWTN